MKRCVSDCISIGAGVLLMTGFAGATLAADLFAPGPTDAPSWTGCFAGVHTGGAFSTDKIHSSDDFNSSGAIAGGQIGCDYQFASAWVVGIGGRAAWSSLTSKTPGTGVTSAGGIAFPTQFTVANDFLASATARVGHSFVGGWLVYVGGGAAWTREKEDIAFTSPFSGIAVDPKGTIMQSGWTAGAGLDWAFAPHWSTNLEYDYYNFGTNQNRLTDPVSGWTFPPILKDTMQTFTVGLNYHF